MAIPIELCAIPQFDSRGDPTQLGVKWVKWRRAFELYVKAKAITDVGQKRALLLHVAGPDVQEVFFTMETDVVGEDDDYEMAMQALTSYFTPKTNIPFERHVFRQARQTEQESVDQFCTRLRQLAITCDFAAEVENMIRDQVVESCNSHSLHTYPEVFTGLGKLKDYQLKLHLDKSVTPVAQAVRRIPYSRRQKVVDKLDELERLDVIEKVSGPTTWVNPLVTVDKPNGDVRICLDMRRANQAITRERHPIPTMEETLQNVGGAKVFAKLDMNMAFHQIELDVDSRDITTFAGPNGLYRYKRLLFGVNMATEKFQHIMWQIVQGLPGVHSMHDDIRVVADNHNQLYERVEAVVKALSAKNLTLNFDKCIMGVDKMTFMGETITSTGLQVSDDKVKAITHAPRPTTKSELRSFLGLAQFCAKYVAGFATITSSLWELTRASAE